MIFLLFILLGLLFAVEASTSLCRKVGYEIGHPDSGLILQGSLSIISRALVFIFMPIVGFLADQGNLFDEVFIIFLSYLIIPVILFLLYYNRNSIEFLFKILLFRIIHNGSYFKPTNSKISLSKKRRYRFRKKLLFILKIVFLAYLPYYLCWPIILILLDCFPDNRGLILGLTSVMNGINTIIITFFIDPVLVKLGRYKRLINRIYDQIVLSRFFSACLAGVFIFLITQLF